MKEKIDPRLKAIADHCGEKEQTSKMVEEMAELIHAFSKYRYEPSPEARANVIEELADVKVMWEQLVYLLKADKEVDAQIEAKIYRTFDRFGLKLNKESVEPETKQAAEGGVTVTAKIPLIRILDRETGEEHIYGTDIHDYLRALPGGKICYCNFQTGEGTAGGGYAFAIEQDPEMERVKNVTPGEYIDLLLATVEKKNRELHILLNQKILDFTND